METTARGDVPKTLHSIAFVSIPDSADLEFLLWDLQDAIAAYAQLSGTALPHPVDLKANSADTADGIVNGGSILALGAVDLERADLGSRGALGVLGDVRVHGAGDVGVLAQDELIGPNLDIALDGAIDSHRIARKRCRLGRAAQATVSPIA